MLTLKSNQNLIIATEESNDSELWSNFQDCLKMKISEFQCKYTPACLGMNSILCTP